MGNPSMWLLRKNNTLRIQIALETRYDDIQSCSMETFDGHNNAHVDGNANGNNNGNESNQNEVLSKTCDIEHFPLQRWVCVNISLTNNILDISFNGDFSKELYVTRSTSN